MLAPMRSRVARVAASFAGAALVCVACGGAIDDPRATSRNDSDAGVSGGGASAPIDDGVPAGAPEATGTVLAAVSIVADRIGGSSVVFDAAGRMVIAGHYESAMDVDVGSGIHLPAASPSRGFVAAYDTLGTCLWATSLRGAPGVSKLAAAPNGDVVFAADSLTNDDFVQLDGVPVPISKSHGNVVIGRIDASGKQVWLEAFASPGVSWTDALAVDASGQIAVGGRYTTSDTDLTFDGQTAVAPSRPNPIAFVATFGAAGLATAVRSFWYSDTAKQSNVAVSAVAFSAESALVVAGGVLGTMAFRPDEAVTRTGDSTLSAAFLLKLDPGTMSLEWVRVFGAGPSIASIAMTPTGGMIAAVEVPSTVVKLGDTLSFPAATPLHDTDVGIAGFERDGAPITAVSYRSPKLDNALGVAVDPWGEPIVVGTMGGTIDFGGKLATAPGVANGFIAKLTPTGRGRWAYGVGSSTTSGFTGGDAVTAVAVDPRGNIACTGTLGTSSSPSTLLGKTVNLGAGKTAAFLVLTSP
jgi:hypothetical protein